MTSKHYGYSQLVVTNGLQFFSRCLKNFFLFKRKTTFLCSRTLAAAMLRLYSFSQKFANIYGLFNLPFLWEKLKTRPFWLFHRNGRHKSSNFTTWFLPPLRIAFWVLGALLCTIEIRNQKWKKNTLINFSSEERIFFTWM